MIIKNYFIISIVFVFSIQGIVYATNSGIKATQNNKTKNDSSAENMYMVSDIVVSKSSKNSLEAKEECIKEAQRKALKTILERAKIDVSYTKYIDSKTLEDMVESIQIRDEMMTKNSYSSRMTIIFSKKFLNFYLKRAGIGVNNITYDVFLYIPLFKNKNGKIDLMNQNSIWYNSAYNDFFDKKYENLFIIDNYSLSNSGLINEKMILEPKYEDYSTLLKKYSSNVVVIAIAEYDSGNNSINVNYKEIDGDKTVEKPLTYFNRHQLSYNDLVAEVSVKMLEYLNGESQMRIYNKKGQEKTVSTKIKEKDNIDVLVDSSSVENYVYVKNLLTNVDFVTRIEIIEMTSKYVKLRLYYKCAETELLNLFKGKGFELSDRFDFFVIKYVGF